MENSQPDPSSKLPDHAMPKRIHPVRVRVRVPPGTSVQLTLEVDVEPSLDGDRLTRWQRLRQQASDSPRPSAAWLTILAIGVYLFTRLYALPAFPIYFFTDEAIQTVSAVDLLNHHLFGPNHEFLPVFFQNGSQYNLSTSVYVQTLPYILFGQSIWVTRGVAALMTLIAVFSVERILRRFFHSPYPWLAVLFLALTPAWFLHSRTAFETSLAASLFAGFLYAYLVYRCDQPRALYSAVAFGALVCYAYSAARGVMAAMALFLLIADAQYHWRNRGVVLRGVGLGVLLGLPYARFGFVHPDAAAWQLNLLQSYWIQDIPLLEKIHRYFMEYIRGLDPLYWYLPQNTDLIRHTMRGYGHLLRQTLPLGILGIVLALRSGWRSAPHRTILLAVLAAPAGAALVQMTITRALVMVIPMSILTALAASACLEWLHRHGRIGRGWLAGVSFVILACGSLYMLRDALVNGPTWYTDYGLSGMQYGAPRVFDEVLAYHHSHPQTQIILSPTWSNGTDVVARFFVPDAPPFTLGSITGYARQWIPIAADTLFVMTPEEFAAIPPTRFTNIRVEKTLPYPDGQSGFYFVRLSYVANIQEVIAQEERARRMPVREDAFLPDHSLVTVTHSPLDLGILGNVLDDNPDTLVRSAAINPLDFTVNFAEPRPITNLTVRIGGTATTIHVTVWITATDPDPLQMEQSVPATRTTRDVTFSFPAPLRADRVMVSVANTLDTPMSNVHVWDILFQ